MTKNRIVTGPGGTRYRRYGKPCGGGLRNPVGPCLSFYVGHNDPEKAICKGHHTLLPRIPHWPLPGQAPQYLTDDGETILKAGDVLLMRFDRGIVNGCDLGFRVVPEEPHPLSIHGFQPGHSISGCRQPGCETWLIRRADPGEDIDHDA